MEKFYNFLVFALISLFFYLNTYAQVGVGTTTPNSSSSIDLAATNKGILINRIALMATNNTAPVNTPANGLLVFNIATTTSGNGFDVSPGFYYYSTDSSTWIPIGATTGDKDWFVENTTSSPTDINDNIYTNGEVGIGTNQPNSPLHIFENTGTAPTASDGSIILEHGNAGGQSSVVFKSRQNNNDYGYIAYSDNGSPNSGSTENSLLEIGVQNDPNNNYQDDIRLNSSNAILMNTNGNERMRVNDAGLVSINTTTPYSTDRFTVIGNANEYAVNAYGSGSGAGVYSQNTGSGYSLWAVNSGTGTAIRAYSQGTTTPALSAVNNSYDAIATTTSTDGTANAIWARNDATSGTGTAILASSGLATSVYAPNGAGVAASGRKLGIYGYATEGARLDVNRGNSAGSFILNATSGATDHRATAKIAGYDNVAPRWNSNTGSGSTTSGGTLTAADSYFGGYFTGGATGSTSYSYTGMKYSTNNAATTGTNFKVIGNGTNSTIIKDAEGTPRIMFSPEAPEILFQDYGEGSLVNGEAKIELDPVLKHSLYVDEEHPLRVFITLHGDCNGTYVTDRSINGFTVKELAGGKSNISFTWQIVANRADDKDKNGNITSKHVGLRLPVGPGPLKEEPAKYKEKQKEQATDIKR